MQEEAAIRDWASDSYGNKTFRLWIYDEDKLEEAEKLLQTFLANPEAEELQGVQPKPQILSSELASPTQRFLEQKLKTKFKRSIEKTPRSSFRLTNFLIAVCSAILLLTLWTQKDTGKIPPAVRNEIITTSPLQKTLLFDYPKTYELLDKIIALYGYESLLKPNELPPTGKLLYEEHLKTPAWPGVYPYFIALGHDILKNKKMATQTWLDTWQNVKLFEKIREGEAWRLVTPILLHAEILHLFFNMIWLLLLGTQIENRIGLGRYILFIVIVAILSNVAQYLATGPAFLGFSGVVCGMAFFMRARQKIAPWEGYQMTTGTFYFILFFIGLLAILSIATFFLEVFQITSLQIIIANSAHITGAVVGYLLGRVNTFSWHEQKIQ